ncbi:MAG: hypothetical protein K2X03_10275, partial [Bryobacteraceae bacterium]|nr:hypothetical protein [Bryobacteraceae bacterium]
PEPEEEPTPIEPKSEIEITPNEPKPTPEEQAAEAKRRAFQRHININLGRHPDWEPPISST